MDSRKQDARLDARARRQLLDAALELSGMVCLVLDRDGRILDVSTPTERALGRSAQQLSGQPWTELWAGDEPAPDPWHWVEQDHDALDATHTLVLRHLENETRLELEAHAVVLDGNGRDSLCLIGQLTDGNPLSAPPHARRRTLFEQSPVAMHTTDLRGTLLEVNPAWLNLLGYARSDEVVGRRWQDLIVGGDDDEALGDPGADLRERDHVQDVELALRARDGSRVDVLFSASLVSDDAAEAEPAGGAAVVAFLVDITERRQAAVHLRQARDAAETASRAKSAFLANMSHELRTPLNGILGYSQLLERHSALTPEQRRGIEAIRRSGEHLLTLINDVLDLARIETNREELQREPFHLSEFLREIAGLVRVKAEKKHIALGLELAPGLADTVRGDSRKLRQILLNLLGNAVKFTERGGITLRVAPVTPDDDDDRDHGTDQVRFEVVDTGVGIAAELIERIFQPFEQVGPGRLQMRSQGTGLGLAIVRELVDVLDGRVGVESRPGAGSCFWVELALPASDLEPPTRHERPARRIGYAGPRRRVLVVDDQWENRAVTRRMLEPLGFEIDEAADGLEALQIIEATHPDAVLLDLLMPGLEGREVARRIRARTELDAVRVVGLSSRVVGGSGGDDETSSVRDDVACDAFLSKPIRAEEVLDVLGDLLELDWQTTASSDVARDERAPAYGGDREPSTAGASGASGDASGDTSAATAVALPASELRELHTAAAQGRIVDVRREVRRLEALVGRPGARRGHALFVRQLARFVRQFQLEELVDFLEQHDADAH